MKNKTKPTINKWSELVTPIQSNQHFVGALIAGGASLLGAGIGAVTGAIQGKKNREAQAQMQEQQMKMQEQAMYNKRPPGSEGVVPGVANPYMLALGGHLNTNTNENINLVNYENGGTHSMNPLGGIPIGTDKMGTPNTVEEGESSYKFEDGKYIFSNRLTL